MANFLSNHGATGAAADRQAASQVLVREAAQLVVINFIPIRESLSASASPCGNSSTSFL
jgi:hypothetical protein